MHDDVYELHFMAKGRWSLAERFQGNERESAIEEAKRKLKESGVEAVRVVRERYDAGDQMFKQRTVFRDARAKAPAKPDAKETGARPGAPAARAAGRPPAHRPVVTGGRVAPSPPRPKSEAAVAPQIATESAAGQTGMSQTAMGQTAEPEEIGQGQLQTMPSLVKRVALATTAGLTMAGGGALFFWESPVSDVTALGVSGAVTGSIALFIAAFVASLYLFGRQARQAEREFDGEDEEVANDDPKKSSDPETIPMDFYRRQAKDAEREARIDAAFAPPAAASVSGTTAAAVTEPVPSDVPPPANDEPAASVADPLALPVADDHDRTILLQFLRDCMIHESAQPFVGEGNMNARNRFGCHLFLLGAGEACMAAQANQGSDLSGAIAMALDMLGTDSQRSAAFAERIAEYREDARYRAMIDAGRSAMADFITGHGVSGKALAEALAEWNRTPEEPAARDIAILFTDIATSMETVQTFGDEGLLKLVQAHNLIVGSVLKARSGHHVKNTGDGVMAVFPHVADGILAAAEIQRQIADFNVQAGINVEAGAVSLAVRIGVTAGRPLHDQNDYFGAVVQLAARLCAMAAPSEILVSDEAWRLATETEVQDDAIADMVMPQAGELELLTLKGFNEPQMVRRLDWQAAPEPLSENVA